MQDSSGLLWEMVYRRGTGLLRAALEYVFRGSLGFVFSGLWGAVILCPHHSAVKPFDDDVGAMWFRANQHSPSKLEGVPEGGGRVS